MRRINGTVIMENLNSRRSAVMNRSSTPGGAPDNTLSLEEIRFRLESYGSVKICPEHQKLNFRTYNDSCAKAKKLFPGP